MSTSGVLYVVATPIGHLADISQRAVQILREVDLILAEDTRQTAVLLHAYAIQTPLRAYHEHNEAQLAPQVAEQIATGQRYALVSDAGTPLISDPGFRLVRELRQRELRVIPIPGASALICALSASGLPSDRFLFAGFPPRTSAARQRKFRELATEPGTLIFYESGQRLRDTLADLAVVLGTGRHMVLARELTKHHETFLQGRALTLIQQLDQDSMQLRGEHVLLVEGADQTPLAITAETERVLQILLEVLPVKQAATFTARITGARKNDLYRLALKD